MWRGLSGLNLGLTWWRINRAGFWGLFKKPRYLISDQFLLADPGQAHSIPRQWSLCVFCVWTSVFIGFIWLFKNTIHTSHTHKCIHYILNHQRCTKQFYNLFPFGSYENESFTSLTLIGCGCGVPSVLTETEEREKRQTRLSVPLLITPQRLTWQ